ncbi:TetR/AcrR family transcriptional regulator [Clostridium sp. MT-14]|uniref:TetR/AcrR family transcriptional regulator n=1 Tax=Clostridium aromativorans TaxID=2836848 RepID=A0ABS8NCA7_9CLOT|nr:MULTISPECIES: TetR/AcrR family transcriptional regulator [Clostridium]KAA8664205.1 TetR/AcrR family transcriptional regulator [Clostridium sp. HV4-5-A1G]MCC9296819.1 TetR/AcrR family transcriptional regulator [Clostridium aromativorans]CAB1262795.1 TetR family transcriptional regulator [Clostridiaceae bacterium BL-3]
MNNTKRTISESAIKVFSKNGYNGATMDAIAADAGVAKGTLYYHFKSKEEIFKYIVQEGMNVLKGKIESDSKDVSDSLEKIRILCRVQWGLIYESRDFIKVIMSQIWGQEARQLELRECIKSYIVYIQNYLKEAVDDGSIKKCNLSFLSYTLFGTVCSVAVYELMNEDKKDLDDMIESLMNYILNGIKVEKENKI